MNLRIGILILLTWAAATAERYRNEKSSYVKSSGESEESNCHDAHFNFLGVKQAAEEKVPVPDGV